MADKKGKPTEGVKPDKTPSKIDFSSIPDEQFEAVFSDKRIWEHKRFKELNEKAKKAEELINKAEQEEEERLKSQKKFEELHLKAQEKAKKLEEELKMQKIDNLVQLEAVKANVRDVEIVTKLLDKDKIKVDENGQVSGVKEAIEELIEAKPYLKADNTSSIGDGSSSSNNSNNLMKFTRKQIEDPEFFKEHEADIMKAVQVEGAIVED